MKRWRELVTDRKKWKDIVHSTGQSPLWAVEPMEEEDIRLMKHTNTSRNSGVLISLFSLYFEASVNSCSLLDITRAYLLCNVVAVVKLFVGG